MSAKYMHNERGLDNSSEPKTALYICDGKSCPVCNPSLCHLTTDVTHALHFAKLPGSNVYMELTFEEYDLRGHDGNYIGW